jgi:NTP pyrophosphatase (non-canonical NTP hydrolase)
MAMNKKEYLLICLAEEASEVAQAASKCLRFTTDHMYGGYTDTNIERLNNEVSDLFTILHMLEEELKMEFDKDVSKLKMAATAKYMKISNEMGVLNESS